MSVPSWVYKEMSMGTISVEEVEQLEKLASELSKQAYYDPYMYGALDVTNKTDSAELTDRQLRNRMIQAQATRPETAMRGGAVGALAGGLTGLQYAGSPVGAAVGALGGSLLGGLAGYGKSKLDERSSSKQLALRKQMDKQARAPAISKQQMRAAIPASPAMRQRYKNRPAGAKYLSVKGRLYKFAQAASSTAVAGAREVVQDPSNNLDNVMKKTVSSADRANILKVLRRMKETTKVASQPLSTMGQAGLLLGGAALAPVISQLAMKGIDRFSKKSPAQVKQDLRRILEVHPEIGRPEDPRVQMAYQSLVKLNPEYAEDPLIAGPLLKQVVDSRMDPTNPMSNPIVDPGIAKGLSEARKALREGKPRSTFGDRFGQSMGQGVQMATMGGLASGGLPDGELAPPGFLR